MGRTCIYVSRNLDVGKWRMEHVPEEAGSDITSISIQTNQGKIWVHSVYNPPPLSHSSSHLGTLRWLPQILAPEGQHILVGDFNLHHPRWGGSTVFSHHKLAEHLISVLSDHNMELILPQGTITWKSRGSQSTLDLAFISKDLEDTVIGCYQPEQLESSSDHIPICTELQIEPPIRPAVEPRPCWKMADWEVVNKRLAENLEVMIKIDSQLLTTRDIDQRVADITIAIQKTVDEVIPKGKPSRYAKPYWTKECTRLVKEARRARRRWTQQGTEDSWVAYNKTTNRKKVQIKRDKMIGWRALVSEVASDPTKIWKLAKWARKSSEETRRLPQIPNIRDGEGNLHTNDRDKARVMSQHFFPPPVEANIEGIAETTYPTELERFSKSVDETEIGKMLVSVPGDKTPGPDGIPNRLLKQCRKILSKPLAELFNACLSLEYHPKGFKESITVVLRKPQKPRYDTPKAYRPIALLNTMGKLLEKLIANRISKAAEEYNLLPEEQMGARPKRSTISAIELLTEQIHTIWGKDKRQVASILSLDISGAFDNVSHDRLIHNLREKGIPRWVSQYIRSFLEERTTSIVLGSFKGEQTPTYTGIPQGSSLSPILFLFFASTLLPALRTANSSAVGFVDDTNILTWSNTTEENCQKLEQLHEKCIAWAKSHGVKFAPDKYQLMHFSRARKRHNFQAPIRIQGHTTNPQTSLRILGIQLDPKLNWGAHVKSVQLKADTQMQALSRLTQSTWGATFHKAKMLYNTIVRPALTYGSPVWAETGTTGEIPQRIVKPLQSIHRKCLLTITGAYKSTSTRVLEHETSILPMEIYLKNRRVQHAGLTHNSPVQKTIEKTCRMIRHQARSNDKWGSLSKERDRGEWAKICCGEESIKGQKEMGKIAAFQEWKNSWPQPNRNLALRHRATADPEVWRAANFYVDKNSGRQKMSLRGTPSNLHRNLNRAQSSIA
ncbi:hypothetical protein K3495_g12605, partial [Podosphaera aphanis]